MSSIKDAIVRLGTGWSPAVAAEMFNLYEPLHAAQAADLESSIVSEKGLKYGPNPRHRIDVYSPRERSGLLPVLVYIHGGGYVSGDNNITGHVYGNIASYFARNGCIGCLATYRLMPEAKYPDCPDDVAASLRWIKENIASYGGDPTRVIAAGHSAGGAHLASTMFLGQLGGADGSPALIRGAIFLSAALTFALDVEIRQTALESYFSTQDHAKIQDQNSVGLFQKMKGEIPCELLMIMTDYEMDEVLDGNLAMLDAYRKKLGKLPVLEILEGHNHISYVLGIGLEGDETGPRMLRFIRSV